jgi:hypothetical protein
MENDAFRTLVSALAEFLGSPDRNVSGTGSRFKSSRKGKATVYHSGIAAGNQAEVAFEVESMAQRFNISPTEFRAFVAQLRAATGRLVEPNPQYNWPRIGVASQADVSLVVETLRHRLPPVE